MTCRKIAGVEGGHREELFEREEELARLEALIERSRAGEGRVLVLQGAAGVGKTRLLEEATHLARAVGMRVLTARGGELERDFAWSVVRQLLERPLAAEPSEKREFLFAGAARHAAAVLGLEEGGASTTADGTFAAAHGLYWLCVNLAAREPLLIAVDDAHWADASSLRFLAYLARRLGGLAVLLAVAARPAEPAFEQELLSDIGSAGGAETIRPAALSRSAVARLVRSRMAEAAEEEFCAACHLATGGNPFLVHELVTALEAAKVKPTAVEARRVKDLGAEAISRGVLTRVRSLPPGATRLVEALALLGANAEYRHAAAIAELDEAAAAEAADALAAVEVIRIRQRLEFVHPIVGAAIYASIPPARRALAHHQAAHLLASEGASPDHVAAQLLQSERRADPWAVEALRDAATIALDRGAPEAAAAYLRRALAEPPGDDLRPAILHELGSAELRAGELTPNGNAGRPPAVTHLQEALRLSAEPRERARIGLELGEALWASQQHVDGIAVFERAIVEAAETEPKLASLLEARLLAAALLDLASTPLALRRLEDIGEIDGRSGPERAILGARALAALLAGRPADIVVGLAERALAGKESLEEQTSPGALMHAAQALTCADRIDDADRFYSQTITNARAHGAVRPLSVALCWRSHLRYRAGALGEAEADAQEALDLASDLGWSVDLPASRAFLADALAARGDLSRARDLLQPDLAADAMPNYIGWNYLLYSRGCVRVALGEARQGLADLLACGERQTRWRTSNPSVIPWRASAALASAALHEPEPARRLVDEEVLSARAFGARRALGIALRAAGLVEGGEKGLELVREAVAVLERSPAQLELARAMTDLGAALRRQGQRAAARDPLRRGLDLAHRLGAASLAEQARTELLATGARPRRLVLTGIDALTASERRVAGMAAEGMTNREIAQALFITQRTVETHLSHVYRKLGVSTRSDLADALAPDSGPADLY